MKHSISNSLLRYACHNFLPTVCQCQTKTSPLLHKYFRYFSTGTSALPCCGVGAIGQSDHGKTTLASAITKYCSKSGKSEYVPVENMNRGPRETSRNITINLRHVGYNTDKRRYAHVDCPGHARYLKNMIAGMAQMDGAILVVGATDGQMPQTREHLIIAKQVEVKKIIAYLNKADLVNREILEMIELEIRDLLNTSGFDGPSIPIIHGSALLALQGDQSEYGEPSIRKLLDSLDEYFEIPVRDTTSPLYLPTDNFFSTDGKRSTVLTGSIKRGKIRVGDEVTLQGFGERHTVVVHELEVFHKQVVEACAGDHVGVLIKEMNRKNLKRGFTFCAKDSVRLSNYIEAELNLLTKSEANSDVAVVTSKFNVMLYCETWAVHARIHLSSDVDVLEPGDRSTVKILLSTRMPLLQGQRFTIRLSSDYTLGTGIVTRVKSPVPHVHPHRIRQLVLLD